MGLELLAACREVWHAACYMKLRTAVHFKNLGETMAITKKSLISNNSSKKATKKASPKSAGKSISSAKLATAMQTTLKTTLRVARVVN